MKLTEESKNTMAQLKKLLNQANELAVLEDLRDLKEVLSDCQILCNHITENSKGNE